MEDDDEEEFLDEGEINQKNAENVESKYDKFEK